jgi:predicted permease
MRDTTDDARVGTDAFRELRLATRAIYRSPGFFAIAVTILALGLGMSTAMFSLFRTVLVRQLPVVDQDRIVVLWTYAADPNTEVSLGTKSHAVVRQNAKTLRDLAAIAHWPATAAAFKYGDASLELNRGMVTGNFFDVLGAKPALGRLMGTNDDEVPNMPPTATRALVLSYRAWREKFGGDSAVIGRHLTDPLVHTDYEIIGVAPPGLAYPAGVEYWIPMWAGWQSGVSSFSVARLAPGATVAQARAEYAAIESRLGEDFGLRGAHAATFTETILGNVRPVLNVLTAAVALLLLIACLNVGNLLLLRASTRARELAVRRALGASFGHLFRQLFAESLVIAVGGGVLGLVVAVVALRMLVSFAPPNVPRLDDVQLAGAPVAVAAAVFAIGVLLFGVLPALVIARGQLAPSLRLDARIGNMTVRRRLVRQTLVASQMALAMVLLGGAGLLVRSLERLQSQDTGFEREHVSVLWYSWNARKDTAQATLLALGERVRRQVRAIPGVTAATQMVAPPMLGNGVWNLPYEADGPTASDTANFARFPTDMVGPEFFKTFGVRLVRGRAFTDGDDGSSALVVIVSESVARRFWPGRDAVGQRLRMPAGGLVGDKDWRTVVGVAHDTHFRLLRESSPMIYLPSMQGYWQGSIAIRSTTPLPALIPALRAAGKEADPDIELWQPQTMDEIVAEPLAQPRLSALLASSFGVVALVLAAIGLFGVMGALVRDRMREFGIRIALGAQPSHVRFTVLRQAGVVAGIGAVVGLAAAMATSRLVSSLLFGVTPTDPLALGGACLVLLVAAGAAAYLPARRATSIDPVRTLRAD